MKFDIEDIPFVLDKESLGEILGLTKNEMYFIDTVNYVFEGCNELINHIFETVDNNREEFVKKIENRNFRNLEIADVEF